MLLTGAEANEVFFRATDEELDQAAAYPFMTPVFGEGVVFDASPEERRRALHNQSLRDKFMRGHAATITAEIERMLADWDDEGTIDLLDFTAELFIYTSTAAFIGHKFREELDGHVAELFHDLERHRRHRLRRPLRGHRELAGATPPGPSWSRSSRDHGPPASGRTSRRRRGARPGRRAHVDHEPRRSTTSPPTPSPACSSR
ncbi:MAG: hypothetical protein R2702_02400 [Acidimicrobiales bacterium]